MFATGRQSQIAVKVIDWLENLEKEKNNDERSGDHDGAGKAGPAATQAVDARLHELLESTKRGEKALQKPIGKVLLEFAGKAQGLPADYSTNLDHYLHGVPKRQP